MPLAVAIPSIPARVQAAIRGDEKARRELLTELLPRVRNLVRYLVRRDDDTDDITQDALVTVLDDLAGYRGEGKFEAWVDRIVVRLTIARIRKRRFQWQRDTQYDSGLMLASPSRASDEFLYRRQIVRLLDALPLDQRHALVFHYMLDMTIPEIAAELEVPVETIRSRLRLAKSRLRSNELHGPERREPEG